MIAVAADAESDQVAVRLINARLQPVLQAKQRISRFNDFSSWSNR
jgi:hypothetical protein